jgi:hypothetical protein
MMVRAVTLLPDPDSPTRPIVFPSGISIETWFRATLSLVWDLKATWRSSMRKRLIVMI